MNKILTNHKNTKSKYETLHINYRSKNLLYKQKGVRETYSDVILRLCVTRERIVTVMKDCNSEALIHVARTFGWTGGKVGRAVITDYLIDIFQIGKEEVY